MSQCDSLPYILVRNNDFRIELSGRNHSELKTAARFWFGTKVSSPLRKDDCARAITDLLKDKERVREGVKSLSPQQKQILSIFKRHGGEMPGALLQCELLARNLTSRWKARDTAHDRRKQDFVADLCDKFLLAVPDDAYPPFGYSSFSYRIAYPPLSVLPAALEAVEPAHPLIWKSSGQPPVTPRSTFLRSLAEIALDVMAVAQALDSCDEWKTNRGGSLAKAAQKRLNKVLPSLEHDPMAPPALDSFYYEILRGMNAIETDEDFRTGFLDMSVVQRHLSCSDAIQARNMVRGWMQSRLWQDGIGLVADRDNHYEAIRIDPNKLSAARELLSWALCQISHSDIDWLDLETFLLDLWAKTRDEFDFYWGKFDWHPKFEAARNKDSIPTGDERHRAFWIDEEGAWAANAIMGSLTYLGLVERGEAGRRLCFRLTEVGRVVFGAPELQPVPPREEKFLTIQPNHEVLLYLDSATAGSVGPLAQMAQRVSAIGERVQTFVLSRDSIYQGLESGLTLEEILGFLEKNSKTGLPANVAQSIQEWGRKRESLVVRFGVTLAVAPLQCTAQLPTVATGRRIGAQFMLLPFKKGAKLHGLPIFDHTSDRIDGRWKIDDKGNIRVEGNYDLIGLTRLSQFTEDAKLHWTLTPTSVRKARDRGINAEQILGYLTLYLNQPVPPLLETLIRNWSNSLDVFLGTPMMLQVADPKACAVLKNDPRFQPCLVDHIPPSWFVVDKEKKAELEQLLHALGFSIASVFKPTTASGGAIDDKGQRKSRGRPKGKTVKQVES